MIKFLTIVGLFLSIITLTNYFYSIPQYKNDFAGVTCTIISTPFHLMNENVDFKVAYPDGEEVVTTYNTGIPDSPDKRLLEK
jgi:hypothetical protein